MLDKLIKVVVSKDVWRAVADDQVDTFDASKHLLDLLNRLLSCNVTLDHSGSLYWCHLKEVNGDQVSLA